MVLADKKVDGFFKERPQVPVATGADLPEIATDHVLVLQPDASRFYPGKTVTLEESGEIAVTPYGRAVWFRPLQLPVDGIQSLHAAFTRVAETVDGPGLIVRGQVWEGADPRSITRRKTGRKASRRGNVIIKGRPRGLEDAAHHWAVLDLDKVPNLLAIDPRVEPERAIAFLRGLLPLSLRDVRMSWQWSSSTCLCDAVGRPLPADQPPEALGVHLRLWLDEPMAEADPHGPVGFIVGKAEPQPDGEADDDQDRPPNARERWQEVRAHGHRQLEHATTDHQNQDEGYGRPGGCVPVAHSAASSSAGLGTR